MLLSYIYTLPNSNKKKYTSKQAYFHYILFAAQSRVGELDKSPTVDK